MNHPEPNLKSSFMKSAIKYAGDRFIPNRASTNLTFASYFISDPKSNFQDAKNSSPIYIKDQANSSFSKLIEETLFSNATVGNTLKDSSVSSPSSMRSQQIINYRPHQHFKATPSLNDSFQSTFKHALEVSALQSNRSIPQVPEKMLDAPDILDDYYLNLMDWSQTNIISISLDKNLYLWNYTTGAIELLISDPLHQITAVSFMGNGECLCVGFSNSTLQLWDIIKSHQLRHLPGHSQRVASLSWNQHIVSSGSRDTEIINHDVRVHNNISSRYQGHSQEICGLRWSLDGLQLASGSNDNNLIIWDPAKNSFRFKFTDHKAAVKALAWSPWQKGVLASGGGTADKCIKFWDCDTGKLLKSYKTDSQVSSIIWNRYEKEILSSHGYSKNQLSLWKYPTMQNICELKGHLNRVLQMSESPDGEVVVSASADETLRFWRVFQRRERRTERIRSQEVILKGNDTNIR